LDQRNARFNRRLQQRLEEVNAAVAGARSIGPIDRLNKVWLALRYEIWRGPAEG